MNNWLRVFFLFFILGFLVYFNSLNNKFLFDDYSFLNNPVYSNTKFILSQWNPYREQALGVMDSAQHVGYYRPMAHMVLDFCYSAFKNDFWKYHFLNLFLFVLASSLIYLLIERITGNYKLAFLTGLFYLIHPINGIIVNYISASVFAFQVICTVGTVLLLLESLERKNDRTFYVLSLVFSFFSLFWNESGVMVPFYVCAFILIFRKDPLKNKVFYLFPYFLIVFAYLVFRAILSNSGGNVLGKEISSFHLTGWEYLASLFQVFSWYISKLVFPRGIVMQWSTPILHGHLAFNVLGLILLFASFILLFIRFSKEKILQMAIIWIFIGFAPVFLASIMRLQDGIEIEPHWFVVSSIGFFILAAYLCVFAFDRLKKIGFALVFILILTWGSVSHAYNQLWADQKTYALYWSQQAPDLKSTFYYLATAYHDEGDLNGSLKYLRKALTGYPSDGDIYICIGIINYSEGDLKEAELNYKKALQINPRSSFAYNNLGELYLKEGQSKKAGEFFRQALSYNPLMLEPRRGLATIFVKHGNYKKAIDLCLINLGIADNDIGTLSLLLNIYIQKQDLDNVKKCASRIINSQTDPEVLTSLEIVMAKNNAPDIALDCFTKAVHVDPDYKDAYFVTGALFANLGKYDEAIHIWRLGSSIDPSDQRFNSSIAKAEDLNRHLTK